MKQPAIIWRESIYKNNFTCNCGEKLGSDEGDPIPDMLMDEEESYLVCPKCMKTAARLEMVELPEGTTEKLQGDWLEYIKRTKS